MRTCKVVIFSFLGTREENSSRLIFRGRCSCSTAEKAVYSFRETHEDEETTDEGESVVCSWYLLSWTILYRPEIMGQECTTGLLCIVCRQLSWRWPSPWLVHVGYIWEMWSLRLVSFFWNSHINSVFTACLNHICSIAKKSGSWLGHLDSKFEELVSKKDCLSKGLRHGSTETSGNV